MDAANKKQCARALYDLFKDRIDGADADEKLNGIWIETDGHQGFQALLRTHRVNSLELRDSGLIMLDATVGDMSGLDVKQILAAKDAQLQTQIG